MGMGMVMVMVMDKQVGCSGDGSGFRWTVRAWKWSGSSFGATRSRA